MATVFVSMATKSSNLDDQNLKSASTLRATPPHNLAVKMTLKKQRHLAVHHLDPHPHLW